MGESNIQGDLNHPIQRGEKRKWGPSSFSSPSGGTFYWTMVTSYPSRFTVGSSTRFTEISGVNKVNFRSLNSVTTLAINSPTLGHLESINSPIKFLLISRLSLHSDPHKLRAVAASKYPRRAPGTRVPIANLPLLGTPTAAAAATAVGDPHKPWHAFQGDFPGDVHQGH